MRPTRLLPLLLSPALALAADWVDMRGPNRDGTSPEKNLVEKWSPDGLNLLWKAPFGGRSTPVVFGDRVYVFNGAGKEDTARERVMCLDANTGKVIWEYHSNVYHSDVPAHRIAWSSPAVDVETGNVYVYGVSGNLIALDRNGKKLWERSLNEEYGHASTHGGRTVSPLVEGGLVIVSAITNAWGESARAAHRFFGFDKRTGVMVWMSTPTSRPYDTVYSPPTVAEINGQKLMINGGSDGGIHALQVNTGKKVWSLLVSKRGLNTGAVVGPDNTVYFSHSEENNDSNEMGMLAAFDGTKEGDLKVSDLKWRNLGFQGGYSSPILDGDILYQMDNSANLNAFDAATGKLLWRQNFGSLQKGTPVLADGKLYIGTENGKVFIVRPTRAGVEILNTVTLGSGPEPEAIIANPAISEGRVYIVSMAGIYAFGQPNRLRNARTAASRASARTGAAAGRVTAAARSIAGNVAQLLVVPAEAVMRPGETIDFEVRSFDANGNFLKSEKAEWATTMQGSISGTGKFTADANTRAQSGKVTAKVGGLTAESRIRVWPTIPLAIDFEAAKPGPPPPYWVNATGKFEVREMDGGKVLAKLADNAFTKRARAIFGHVDEHDYTIEADVRAIDRRRQMGDAGVVAQRYALVLFGNHQRLELQPWQAEPKRTAEVPFKWNKDTWYRLKLRVENLPNGVVRAQGKAWPVGEPEPEKWTIEKIDPVGNRQGSPGIYADAPNEVFIDNIKVTKN
jgi:outer membrane protein assembly factor BamB